MDGHVHIWVGLPCFWAPSSFPSHVHTLQRTPHAIASSTRTRTGGPPSPSSRCSSASRWVREQACLFPPPCPIFRLIDGRGTVPPTRSDGRPLTTPHPTTNPKSPNYRTCWTTPTPPPLRRPRPTSSSCTSSLYTSIDTSPLCLSSSGSDDELVLALTIVSHTHTYTPSHIRKTHSTNRAEYRRRVKQEAAKNPPDA